LESRRGLVVPHGSALGSAASSQDRGENRISANTQNMKNRRGGCVTRPTRIL
jgi:hypothetical protein